MKRTIKVLRIVMPIVGIVSAKVGYGAKSFGGESLEVLVRYYRVDAGNANVKNLSLNQ